MPWCPECATSTERPRHWGKIERKEEGKRGERENIFKKVRRTRTRKRLKKRKKKRKCDVFMCSRVGEVMCCSMHLSAFSKRNETKNGIGKRKKERTKYAENSGK